MRSLACILIAVCAALPLRAQIPSSPNKHNSAGQREGRWTLMLDSAGTETADAKRAVQYRLITYANGKPSGIVRDLYRSGRLQREGTLVGENPETWHGTVVGYFESGKKRYEAQYVDGRKEGTSTAWYENGRKNSEKQWKNNRQEGVETAWYESGKKMYERPFTDGRQDGVETSWFENGKKRYEGTWVDGKKEDASMAWYENGRQKLEKHWKNGREDGLERAWYVNGNPHYEAQWVDGKLHGTMKQWDERGVMSTREWRDGVEVKQKK
jgi:antitoxin component YwqK of YwqJK toxin-antitoxin module